MNERPFTGMRVLELGSRIGAGACGRLLADLGASVWVAEPRTARHDGKWRDRAIATAARESILFDASDAHDLALMADLSARCDVVITSSDVDTLPEVLKVAIAGCRIACDITAFGASGPRAGTPADDLAVQAATGLMDTTGFADGAAIAIGVPIVEMSTGIYAAVATALAWRVLRRDGIGQRIDMSLYDTAFNALSTFLPAHFAGRSAQRLGNGHSMAVPWNAYETRNGWILICSANDAQWRKLAALIDTALTDDRRYALLADRIADRRAVDALVAAWVKEQPLDALLDTLLGAGIPCGPIVPLDALPEEPNLALRGSIARIVDPVTMQPVRVPAALIRFADTQHAAPAIPEPDSGRAAARALTPLPALRAGFLRPPCAGLRVIEIGQFTTAPLAARHLASFRADVIKVEPAEGDSARAWAPHRAGTSHFFVMSNGEKRSLALDLRSREGLAEFERLLANADVLVENMKPGSLDRLGFSPGRLHAINPRLVYCAISGFGRHSAYAGRPAFDTVVQAMCGMMDATRAGDVPMKSGISAADIGGGQVGLLAILAALEQRERTGKGAIIDIAMQDVGAWLTQLRWNVATPATTCDEPVLSVAAACMQPQTVARDLVVLRRDAAGTQWELIASPLRLSATPPHIGTPIGPSVRGPLQWHDGPAPAPASSHGSGDPA